MSGTVDNRVVQLGFDNKQFESGTKQSIASTEALKKSLNFDETSKSLLNLSHVGKNFNLGNMAEGIQNVSSKFSALGVIGFTVLQNLTNSAIDFGKKMVSSLTAPIKQGLNEYETQINAIQTVLANTASKGTTLEDVNSALDTLNTYADKTIYNFTEMTRNIGTFTAAGVDLQTSVDSIKGIANLAAVSGSNSQQAATAMYQLSQAISSGTVRLMDWNSVVNAGMGGQVFQDALKETARVNGIAVDDMIAKNGSFRESLQEGWLSSKVLTETLAKFTGDLNVEQLKSIGYTEKQVEEIMKLGQMANDAATKVKTLTQLKETIQESLVSGWAQSWRIIVGDFEEAKSFFTEVSDTIGPMIQASSDARNKILQVWADLGGREIFIDSLRNTFKGLLSVLAPIKEAFKDIFGPGLRGQDLLKFTKILRNFTEGLTISGETADQLKRIFSGLFAGLKIARDVVFNLVSAFFDLTSSIAPSGNSILEFLARIGDYIMGIYDVINIADIFDTTIQSIKTSLNTAKVAITGFVNQLKSSFEEFKSSFSGVFDSVDTSGIEEFFSKIKIRFEPLTALAKGLGIVLGGLAKIASKLAPSLFKLAAGIVEFVMNLGSSIVEGIGNLDFSKLFDTINSGLFAALLLSFKKFTDSGTSFIGEASGIFGGISGILDGVRGSLEAWQANLKSKTLMNIAVAIAILTVSLIGLASIDSKKLTVALGAVTGMFLQLIGAQSALGKFGTGGLGSSLGLVAMSTSILIMAGAISVLAKLKPEEVQQGLNTILVLSLGLAVLSKLLSTNTASILKSSLGLVGFSLSLLVLVGVVKQLGALDPAELQNGLIGIGVLLAEIAAFMRIVDGAKMGTGKGVGIALLAGSILAITFAVEKLGEMDVEKLKQGLIAVGAVLVGVAAFTQLTGNGAGIIATAIGMAILSGAMVILVDVITKLGALDPARLQNGLIGMGVSLGIVAAAARLLPKDLIITAVGLVIMAGALVILSQALTTMGNMTWDEIARGLVALAGSLLILTVALYAMQGTLAGSAALMVAAMALSLLAPVLVTLGGMSLLEIGLALLTLAGVFVILAVAGTLLTPVVPTLLGLGVSMMLLGVAAALVGVGLLLFSMGLSAIALSGAAAAVAIVAMISTILGVIPLIIKTLIDAIIMFGNGIITATPVVRDAILGLLNAVLDIIIQLTPKLITALEVLLRGLIQLIRDVIPDFIAAVLDLVGELLSQLAAKIPDFVQAGFDILIGFLEGIRDNIGEVVTVVGEIVVEFLDAVATQLPDIIEAGANLMIEFINGMADAIDENQDEMLTALGNLGTAMVGAITNAINKAAGAVLKTLGDIVDAAIAAIKRKLGIVDDDQEGPDNGLPSKGFGVSIGKGVIAGINQVIPAVQSAAEDLGNAAISTLDSVVSTVSDLLNVDDTLTPTIAPVIDLGGVIAGQKEINSLFSTGFNITPNLALANTVGSNLIRPYDPTIQSTPIGTNISLVQHNHSPKALSRLEIYRQTRNQLLTLKGLV